MNVIRCQFQELTEKEKTRQQCNQALLQIYKVKNDSEFDKEGFKELLENEKQIKQWQKALS